MLNKKLLAFTLTAVLGLPLMANGLRIDKHYEVKMNTPQVAYHPQINDEGTQLVFSSEDYEKLVLLDLTSGASTLLAEGDGVGYNPQFSKDSKNVIFNSAEMKGRLKYKKVESVNIDSKKVEELVPLTRENLNLISQKQGVAIVAGKSIKGQTPGVPVVVSDFNKIVVTQNGKETRISPVADAHSYLWVSLSPNGKKILFVEPYEGVFTCNLDGSELKSLGKGDYPAWISDDFIVVSRTKDDGYVVLSSQLYAVNVNTSSAIALTSEDSKAEKATVARNTHKLVYSTLDGKLYAIELSIIEK